MIIVIILIALVPLYLFFSYQMKRSSPTEQWPVLAPDLKLVYETDPSRMTGAWGARRVQINTLSNNVTLTMWLNTPSRLRVDCGPKDEMAKRPALIAPYPVAALEPEFDKWLARCSDQAAAPAVFDSALQGRLAFMPEVDFVGNESSVIWTVPRLKELTQAQAILHALNAVAETLERFPPN
jgi:hypothetical protein